MNANKTTVPLYKPELSFFERDGIAFFIDGASPNWLATDARGAKIVNLIDGRRSIDEIQRTYADQCDLDAGTSWRDVNHFVQEAKRAGIVTEQASVPKVYQGRVEYMKPSALREFWVHLLQTCNLSCDHCLVSSGPKGEKGQPLDFLLGLINQAYDLGARRFYFTGGEPFVRKDIFDLIRHVTEEKKSELIIMTNATLISGERLESLKPFSRERLKFQVSLDGTTPEINDPIRGKGVFRQAAEGLKTLSSLGFEASLTAVVTKTNLHDLEGLPALAKGLGAKSVHLMWPHKRGRILENQSGHFPTLPELLALVRKAKLSAYELGLHFDNWESLKSRVNGPAHVKYDLGNMCWESLCLYTDGRIYPSAAMAGVPTLSLGDAAKQPLESIWRNSEIARSFRSATVGQKSALEKNPFRFITGGGDMEHSYFFSSNGKEGTVVAEDPYHDLYIEMIKDVMFDLARVKKFRWNNKSGFTPPTVFHAMGEDAIACSEDAQAHLTEGGLPFVKLLHSNCVLSFDVEKPYRIVQTFYGKAAVEPQAELCCPIKYDDADVGHIPQEVIDRFYGCGSPISQALVQPGETTLDLGSGAGIDVFISAKKVGASGRAIGVDMTDEMLKVAHACKPTVASNLGYDVVEFKKGYLEKIPLEDKSVDVVTSNCVINLSPDKKKVFSEIWRVLKDHGRVVVADIVCDRPVPLSLQAHRDLWGECISGSLSEDEFVAGLEKAGFYGLSLMKRTFWKEVEGYRFFSVTVRGYKFEKTSGCRFIGQKAIYLGPNKAVIDEEGHLFPRGEIVEVCTDTAAKLSRLPYAGQYRIIEAGGKIRDIAVVDDDAVCCGSEGQACC